MQLIGSGLWTETLSIRRKGPRTQNSSTKLPPDALQVDNSLMDGFSNTGASIPDFFKID